MTDFLKKAKNYWISDASFLSLFLMLFATVFLLPVMIDNEQESTVFLNMMFVLLFFVGVFSSRERVFLVFSISLLSIHIVLKLIRFGNNPYEFYLLERIVILGNLLVFVIINFRLLFRDDQVNLYRIVGAVNVYLLVALVGAMVLKSSNSPTVSRLVALLSLAEMKKTTSTTCTTAWCVSQRLALGIFSRSTCRLKCFQCFCRPLGFCTRLW
jgi:hypothetical protein